MLREHMPELVPTYERLCELAGGGDLEARMLSMWRPPSYLSGCSQGVWTRGEPILVRNYDYSPDRIEGTILSTGWEGRRVIGMSDCLWGLLDGVNDAGLAVSLAFGGRRVVGHGFGVPLVVRYLLQVCATVAEARAVLSRLPVPPRAHADARRSRRRRSSPRISRPTAAPCSARSASRRTTRATSSGTSTHARRSRSSASASSRPRSRRRTARRRSPTRSFGRRSSRRIRLGDGDALHRRLQARARLGRVPLARRSRGSTRSSGSAKGAARFGSSSPLRRDARRARDHRGGRGAARAARARDATSRGGTRRSSATEENAAASGAGGARVVGRARRSRALRRGRRRPARPARAVTSAAQLDLLHNLMLTRQIPDELRARIVELETSVDLRFSRHRGVVRGVEVGDTEIKRILRQSDDVGERREAWEASKTVGAVVADDVRELARLRNEAARGLGHRDWFALSLATDELDEAEADRRRSPSADRVTAEPFARWKGALDERLAGAVRLRRVGAAAVALRRSVLPGDAARRSRRPRPALRRTGHRRARAPNVRRARSRGRRDPRAQRPVPARREEPARVLHRRRPPRRRPDPREHRRRRTTRRTRCSTSSATASTTSGSATTFPGSSVRRTSSRRRRRRSSSARSPGGASGSSASSG